MLGDMDTWRLLITPPAHGAWNMAVDEAILEACGSGESLPTLRLYSWEPPCLSLGYAQPAQDVDMDALKDRGWELVRRPTGGRAILHTDELTYSVVGPVSEARLAGSVLESYNRLAEALVTALHQLGLPAEIKEHSSTPAGRNTNPVCFEVPSTYEITVGGKKLVGSAQARRKDGVLQHGSLPLHGDLTRIIHVLVFPGSEKRDLAAKRLLERATTVERYLGRKVSWDAAAQAYVSAFSSSLGVNLHSADLSQKERSRAGDLVQEKYGKLSWTLKVDTLVE